MSVMGATFLEEDIAEYNETVESCQCHACAKWRNDCWVFIF
jgi:hypothetical protein